MSRNPQPRTGKALGDQALSDGSVAETYVKRSDAHPPVPGRTRNPRIGPACVETDTVAAPPRTTEELRKGVDVGTPGDHGSGPSAQHGSLTYEERQARARRGR